MEAIKTFQGAHRFLSNFYPARIDFEGLIYPTVEHAYQAWKFPKELRWKFMEASSPKAAKGLAKNIVGQRPETYYEEAKLGVMRTLLRLKFAHPNLRKLLLDTGDAELVEGNIWGDMFWGVWGKTGQGRNHLGRLLMELREELKGASLDTGDPN